VLDLVVCHGDILIRDRKMYVVPTPFHLVEGVAHRQTLVLPLEMEAGHEFFCVGDLRRREASELIVGYSFDLETNEICPETIPNPGAGQEHVFRAWRLVDSPADPVSMRTLQSDLGIRESGDEATN
jgi:hypothetical protein